MAIRYGVGFLRLQRGAGEMALGFAAARGVAVPPLGFRHGLALSPVFLQSLSRAGFWLLLLFPALSRSRRVLGWIVGRFFRNLQYVNV